jgi:NitT/TauT family transport system substrate-binding protein
MSRSLSPLTLLAALALGLVLPVAADAQPAKTVKVRASLDFIRYGSNAPYDYAAAKGYFAQYGIDVSFDASKGSQDSITRVASGAYDFGVADFPTLVQFAAMHPDGPKAVVVIIDLSPLSIVSRKSANIRKPADLAGKTLASAETEAGSRLFPAFMKANKLSDTVVKREIVDVRLRDAMLLRGGVDGVIGNNYTVLFNLKGLGVNPDDLVFLNYAEHGLGLYGQGVIASKAMLDNDPETVKNFVRAAVHGWRDSVADTHPAIDAIAKIDQLTKVDLENERLRWFIDHTVITANTKKNGIGGYDAARLKQNIEIVSAGLALPRTPALSEVFDDRFIPPAAERSLPAHK